MGSHSADGHAECVSDLLVGSLFLMVQDQYGSFDLAELVQLLFDGLLKLALFHLLFGVAFGMRKTLFPAGDIVGERDVGAVVFSAALPLVLSYVHGDSVEIGGDEGFAAEVGQGAIEPDKDLLRKVVDMLAASGEAQKRAEDHCLMIANQLLEGEIGVQGGLDKRVRRKFHFGQ